MDKQTPLYSSHIRLHAKMVSFAGYLMPIQYTSIIAEHHAVRNTIGVFDVSHMGEFTFTGKDTLQNLNRILTNDFTSMTIGKARYSPMCHAHGGTVDDLLVYRTGETDYMLVVNASNREKDFEHIKNQLHGDAILADVSDETALIALQGPQAAEIMPRFCKELPQANYSFVKTAMHGHEVILSRTGYTGEDGFEVYCPNAAASEIFDAFIAAGALPCGLGARDTLRMEAAMPLYGHELLDSITPLEAGLARFVKLEKSFTGADALKNPAKRRLIGLSPEGRNIARAQDMVYAGDTAVGFVTSGTLGPTLGKPVCMALISADADTNGLTIDIRGKKIPAVASPLPFYKRNK
jgi:aminomethyltransferase